MKPTIAIALLAAVGVALSPAVSQASVTPGAAAEATPAPSPSSSCPPAIPAAESVEIDSTVIVFDVTIDPSTASICRNGRLSVNIFASPADAEARQSPVAYASGAWDATRADLRVAGLAPDTDYWYLLDFGRAYSWSGVLGPVHTLPATGPTCTVTYQPLSQWDTGFVAQVEVRNTGPVEIRGWQVAWRWQADEQVQTMWGAVPSLSGMTQVATNADYNAVLAPGSGTFFGFVGSATDPAPRTYATECVAVA